MNAEEISSNNIEYHSAREENKKNIEELNCCDPNTGCCDEPIEVIQAQENCCESDSDCCDMSATSESNKNQVLRRDFMKVMGLGAVGFATMGMGLSHPLSATGILQDGYKVPINKNLDAAWLQSLYERGVPETYTGKDLVYIGMPVGGICAGQVYLGGDGKLWLWDIFNDTKEGIVATTQQLNGRKVRARDGSNYIVPVTQEYKFDQGFSIKINQEENQWIRSLDYKGFNDIHFTGQYPMGKVSYKDKELPVKVNLKAFSPFVPLNVEASNYPATVLQYTITNTSAKEVTCELSGWLENPVLHISGTAKEVQLKNSIKKQANTTALFCEALVDETQSELDFQYATQRDNDSMSLLLVNNGEENVLSVAREDTYNEPFVASNCKKSTNAY